MESFKKISPEAIQYTHKTFQEYLAPISVRWHEDEYHLIKDFDLKSWSELAILTVITTTRSKAGRMLALMLERGDQTQNINDRTYYYLLATSCIRETYGLSDTLKMEILSKVADLVPPRNDAAVSALAGAGDLVVPLLTFREGLSADQITYTIDTLLEIDTIDSRKSILTYLSQCSIDDDLLDAAFEAVSYVNREDFGRETGRILTERNDPHFYQSVQGGTLRVASARARYILRYLPRFRTLQIDGDRDEEVLHILEHFAENVSDRETVARLRRIDITNYSLVHLENLRGLTNVTELNLHNIKSIESLNFLSSL